MLSISLVVIYASWWKSHLQKPGRNRLRGGIRTVALAGSLFPFDLQTQAEFLNLRGVWKKKMSNSLHKNKDVRVYLQNFHMRILRNQPAVLIIYGNYL